MKNFNLDYDEVYKLYITQNLRKKELCEIFECSMSVIDRFLNKNKIQKPIDKQIECRKKGCLEKYGVEYISQSAEIQEKIKQTNLKKYGVERYVNPKKAGETNLKRYGFKNATQNEDVKKKTRKTCLEKYGVNAVSKNNEVKEKIKNTNLKRYGTICTLSNLDIQKKAIENYIKKNHLEETDFDKQYLIQLQFVKKKVIDSKRKNKTFNTSSSEMFIKSLLESLYTQVYYQYTSELYPFACDFYIPSEDVYIEYQGSWTHGHRPFDKLNEECLEQLKLWKGRARTSKYYQNAIEVWTKRDPMKRETAKKNNLNWIEFFTMDEFNNWFKSKKEK